VVQSPTFTWLTDLNWTRATNGWGPVERDRANGERAARDGAAIRLDGQTFRKGLGVAANAQVVYNLNGQYRQFFSRVGIDDSRGDKGSVVFQVWADGRKIFDSGEMTGATAARRVSLPIVGVKTLKLVTTDAGDGASHDHGDWAGARLVPATTA
jgi:hypothetical protein